MLPPWAASLRPALTLDLRSLALFRVLLAATLLCDGLARLPLLHAFLTDGGVVPRALITTAGDPARLSLHMVSGALVVQAVLWLAQMVAAAALLVGWRTRAAAFVCWLLALSLAARAPLITTAGDVLAAQLLLFGLFAPLGARWSLDAVSASNPPPAADAHVSFGNLALLLVAATAPAVAALSPHGLALSAAGPALRSVLSSPAFAHAPGTWLLEMPGMLAGLGAAAVLLQLFITAAALAPRARPLLRRLALAASLLLLAGLALSVTGGPLVCVGLAAASLLIDRALWDRLAARFSRSGEATGILRIYHRGSVAARRRALVLRTFLALPATEVLPAEESARVDRLMQSNPGIAVLDRDDSAHLGADAIRLLVQRSPLLFPVASLVARLAGNPTGRQWLTHLSDPPRSRGPQPRVVRYEPLPPIQLAALALALVVVVAQLATAGLGSGLPAGLRTPLAALGLDRGIVLGARELPAGWIVASGERVDGREVDALHRRDTAPAYQQPEPPAFRWRVYSLHLGRDEGAPFRDAFAKVLCDRWNTHPTGDAERLRRLRLILVLGAPGTEGVEQRVLLRHECAGSPPSDE